MNTNLEQIDLLRERTGVSYGEAKEALEKNNFDIVEAIVYLEKENKIKKCCIEEFEESNCKKVFGTVKGIIKKGNRTSFIIKKKDNVILNIPVTVAVIVGVVAPPVALIGIPLAIITNHRIKIQKENGENSEVNNVIDKVSDTVNTAKNKLAKELIKE